MRPYLLKGHERPLTFLKYNREGDIFISTAKDHHPTAWYADSGARLGTYIGHNGTCWTSDITYDSKLLITGSADQTVKLWGLETGECLHTFPFETPARSVDFSLNETRCLVTTDPFMGTPSQIHMLPIASNIEDQTSERLFTLEGPKGRIQRALFGPNDKTFITGGEDGTIRLWDTETGKILVEDEVHKKNITSMSVHADGTHFITTSVDKQAKIFCIKTLKCLKVFTTERPVNSASMSSIFDHVILAGGQDASQVTTTSSKAGGFESKFYHKVFGDEFASVRGHFGPVNTVTYSPDGRSFVTGGEDGYIRLQHFDADYFKIDRALGYEQAYQRQKASAAEAAAATA